MRALLYQTKRKLTESVALFLGVLFFTHVAQADKLQMECGPSEGYSYTAAEGLADEASSGWGPDSISNGMSIFELNLETEQVSYRWRDVRDVWYDASESASEVRVLSLDSTDFSWQVLSVFGDVTEICTFAGVLGDHPKAICVSSKNTALLNSGRTLVADCKANFIASSGSDE